LPIPSNGWSLNGGRIEQNARHLVETVRGAMKAIEKALPRGFSKKIHTSITNGLGNRLKRIEI
jgi:hypothetical protein